MRNLCCRLDRPDLGPELRVDSGQLRAAKLIISTMTKTEAGSMLSPLPRAGGPEVARWIAAEERRQNEGIELIASENWVSRAVREAQGSVLTKRRGGIPREAYYGGCEFIERSDARDRARAARSLAPSVRTCGPLGLAGKRRRVPRALKHGDTILGSTFPRRPSDRRPPPVLLGLDTQGRRLRRAARGRADRLRRNRGAPPRAPAKPSSPELGLCARIDFPQVREIAQEIGAELMVDIGHIAGLVIGLHASPVPHAAS